ncbi:MAG: nitroreductase family protein [Bacteroidales bacterium]
MEFSDLIRTRESIRNYDPERPVPEEVLKRILDAGRLAPSACNNQPSRFILVSSPSMLEKVRLCYHRDWFRDAPHVLIVLGRKNEAWNRGFDGYNSVETDAAIAMTHLILAAENEGVATCWIANFNPELLRQVLNTGRDQILFGITPLGYPKSGFMKAGNKKRKTLGEVAEFI